MERGRTDGQGAHFNFFKGKRGGGAGRDRATEIKLENYILKSAAAGYGIPKRNVQGIAPGTPSPWKDPMFHQSIMLRKLCHLHKPRHVRFMSTCSVSTLRWLGNTTLNLKKAVCERHYNFFYPAYVFSGDFLIPPPRSFIACSARPEYKRV